MAEPDDEQGLIRKSQQGDHAAFEALVMSNQRLIHSVTFRMTGSLADAEDLSQETFIRAFRQMAAYRAEAKFSSWLYRIAVNLCLDWKVRRERERSLLNHWGDQQSLASPAPDSQNSDLVQKALLKLNPKQRAAIILTMYDGLNHADAAQALGCSETTVSWRLFAARAKLKKILTRAQQAEVVHE